MPIDPVAENTIEDENDADFELDDLFKEPNNRSMETVIQHAQGLYAVSRYGFVAPIIKIEITIRLVENLRY
jgi:hypothetical protein